METVNKEYNQKGYLLETIKMSFDGVVLGSGISISQTEVLDHYGSEKELQLARRKDNTSNWPSLLDSDRFKSINGIGGIAFLDAKGLRFYTPAYLSLIVLDYKNCPDECDNLLWLFTNNMGPERLSDFRSFNKRQRRCIKMVLKWVVNNTNNWFCLDKKKTEMSIAKFWSQ